MDLTHKVCSLFIQKPAECFMHQLTLDTESEHQNNLVLRSVNGFAELKSWSYKSSLNDVIQHIDHPKKPKVVAPKYPVWGLKLMSLMQFLMRTSRRISYIFRISIKICIIFIIQVAISSLISLLHAVRPKNAVNFMLLSCG